MTRVLPAGWEVTNLPGGECPRCRAPAVMVRRQRRIRITLVTDYGVACSECEWQVMPPDKV